MTRPLAQRVPDFGASVLPAGDGAVTWRRATLGDTAALHALFANAGAVDHPSFVEPLDDIHDQLSASWLDLSHDSALAEVDGHVIAAGLTDLTPGQDTMRRVSLSGTVHPDYRRRGIGTELLDWQRRRAAELLRVDDTSLPGRMALWSWPGADDLVTIAERAEFSTARWFVELHHDLSSNIPEVPLPEYRVAELSPALHEATRLARNDAFRDHWGSQPTPVERWQQHVTSSTHRDDLSFVALDAAGDVAGFVLADHNELDTAVAGYSSVYIALVGVVRAHRKRGIAPALLSLALRKAAAAGLERAVLDVDVESPTGALGLYTGLGFVEEHRSRAMVLEF